MSQITYPDVNQRPFKGNSVYKGDQDVMGKMEKPVNQFAVLDTEDVEDAQDICDNTGANYIKVKMLFNSLMTKLLDSSNIEELMQRMIAHINMQVKNP